jgi:serine/threonine-protein kinase
MLGAGELSGTNTAGSYRLVRALGSGASRVHEARHDRLAGRFAVKLLGGVEPSAFLRGAQQAAALRHPGIVRVVDYGGAPAQAFVVMEWVEGRSLAALLAERGPFAPDAVARIVDSVALGLQAAHRQGFAHGHLSPEHVLVLESSAEGDDTPGAERTKILGFGLSVSGAGASGLFDITEVTPYMAPEQAAGDASPLADQFGLAAIAYELLTGVAPASLPGRAPASVREFDPSINVVVDVVLRRALSFDPGKRWPDIYTFSQRLREGCDAYGQLEERTRLAPLPLTVSRAAAAPADATPINQSNPPDPPNPIDVTPIELPPVIASVDVDLGTPAPNRLELPTIGRPQDPGRPLQGEIAMNHPPTRPSQPYYAPEPPYPASRPYAPAQPHYGIRPTPTFSFNDDPEPGPLYKPRGRRRRGSGGGLGLTLLVIAAGFGGYYAVQTHAWQEAEPLVARAKEAARSLRGMILGGPSATPSGATPSAAAPAPAAASAPSSAAAPTPAPAPGALASAAAPTAPAIHPDVVPIAPESPPPRAKAAVHETHVAASRAHHPRAHAARVSAPRTARASKALSDEDATEAALLAPPSSGR